MSMNHSLTTNELYVIAAVRSLQGEGYGVSIRARIADTTGENMMLGTIYAALERLEKRKLVLSNWGEASAERGGRKKRIYELTGEGVRVLKSNLEGPRLILQAAQGSEVFV